MSPAAAPRTEAALPRAVPTPARGFRVREAEARDDAAIRALLRASPLPGGIRVALTREPGFFAGLAAEGRSPRAAVAEDGRGRLVGLVSRAEKGAYVNGQVTPVAYLGGLRLQAGPERLAILREGAGQVRRWHAEGEAPFALLTITEGSPRASALLARGRLGFPRLRDLGGLKTYLMRPSAARRLPAPDGYRVRRGVPSDLPGVAACLAGGAERQFYPAYAEGDFGPGGRWLRGLEAGDLFLAFRDADPDSAVPAGVLGLWDQSPFKQTVVDGYSPFRAALRPAWNAWARLRGLPGLPPAGAELRHRKLACVRVPGERPEAFGLLLKAALEAAGAGGSPVAALAHERDPFRPVLESLPALAYGSRLLAAFYPGAGEAAVDALDGRVPYLELGAL